MDDLTIDPRPLVGLWQLDRRLVDLRRGERGCFHGQLEIAAIEDGFDWYESGELHWDGRVAPASRRLILRRKNGGWEMAFADGRLFHPWLLDADLTHPCGDDLYRGRIVAAPDRMRFTWRVTGPAKDQEIHTRLRRT
ncbi:MAG TPA: DUF6314 family protein [Mycobacteriales bacterium]|jgi:hypothetical protein|nr:DUF6314 family protein [Mycobacteriales bacterium]